MSSFLRRFLALVLFAGLASLPAIGQEKPDPAEAMKKEFEELKALVKAQAARIDALEKKQSAPLVPAAGAKAATADGVPSAKPLPKGATGAEVYFKDGFHLRTPDEKFILRIGGRFQEDGRFFTSDQRNTSSFLNRAARIYAQAWFNKDWEVKIEGDFVGGEPELQDGYFAWNHFPEASLKVGQFKQPFSMEQVQSLLFWKFTERPPIDRATTGRDLGVQLSGKLFDERVEYAVGVFNGAGRSNNGVTDNNSDKDAAWRLVLRPFVTSDSVWLKGLYLGGSGTWGNEEGAVADLTTLESSTRWVDFHPSAANAGTVRREGGASAVGGGAGLAGRPVRLARRVHHGPIRPRAYDGRGRASGATGREPPGSRRLVRHGQLLADRRGRPLQQAPAGEGALGPLVRGGRLGRRRGRCALFGGTFRRGCLHQRAGRLAGLLERGESVGRRSQLVVQSIHEAHRGLLSQSLR